MSRSKGATTNDGEWLLALRQPKGWQPLDKRLIYGGIPRTVTTVTLGSIASGGNGLRTVSTPATMVWNPSAAVTNLTGNPSSTIPVNETGALDRDF